MELIIVLIVIGIVATLGITQYGSYRERSLGREAVAHLRLIAAAEKIYRLEMGHYYPSAGLVEDDVKNINTFLNLSLSEANWNDRIAADAEGIFTAYSQRQSGNCEYSINPDSLDPLPNENCPQ